MSVVDLHRDGGHLLLIYNLFTLVSTENFEIVHGKKLKANLIHMERGATSALQCTYQCLRDMGCMSASYNPFQENCHLSKYRINGTTDDERLVVAPSWITSYKGCLRRWKKLGEICYYFEWKWLNYSQAQDYCQLKGGRLAQPQTNATFEVLRTYMSANTHVFNNWYWFGLNDIDVEGTFVWTSYGTVPQYTAWNQGQPDNFMNDDCVCISPWNEFKWNDIRCSETIDTLCEM